MGGARWAGPWAHHLGRVYGPFPRGTKEGKDTTWVSYPSCGRGDRGAKGSDLPRREGPGLELWAECPRAWDSEADGTGGRRAVRNAGQTPAPDTIVSKQPRFCRGPAVASGGRGMEGSAVCLALGAPLTGCVNVGGGLWGSEQGNSTAGQDWGPLHTRAVVTPLSWLPPALPAPGDLSSPHPSSAAALGSGDPCRPQDPGGEAVKAVPPKFPRAQGGSRVQEQRPLGLWGSLVMRFEGEWEPPSMLVFPGGVGGARWLQGVTLAISGPLVTERFGICVPSRVGTPR